MDAPDYRSDEFGAKFEANYTPEPNSGCWLWTGTLANSYGSIYFGGRNVRAHRASYQRSKGELGHDQVVMHICDNKVCVNPEHLVAGTTADNVRDYHKKLLVGNGGFLRRAGVAPVRVGPLRKLSDAQVLAVRGSAASNRDIGAILNINHTVIGLLKRGLAYSGVADGSTPDPQLVERLQKLASSVRSPSGWHGARRIKAREMRAAGATFPEIAKCLGVTKSRAFELARPVPSDPLITCN